jgi:hypothetical protein
MMGFAPLNPSYGLKNLMILLCSTTSFPNVDESGRREAPIICGASFPTKGSGTRMDNRGSLLSMTSTPFSSMMNSRSEPRPTVSTIALLMCASLSCTQ